jgi:hypothetical protein
VLVGGIHLADRLRRVVAGRHRDRHVRELVLACNLIDLSGRSGGQPRGKEESHD